MNFLYLHLTYSIEPILHNIILIIWAPPTCSPASPVIAFPQSLLFLTIYNSLTTLNLTGISTYFVLCLLPGMTFTLVNWKTLTLLSKSNSSGICIGKFSLPSAGDVEDSFPILQCILYTTLSFMIITTIIIIILCWICLFPGYLYTRRQRP